MLNVDNGDTCNLKLNSLLIHIYTHKLQNKILKICMQVIKMIKKEKKERKKMKGSISEGTRGGIGIIQFGFGLLK